MLDFLLSLKKKAFFSHSYSWGILWSRTNLPPEGEQKELWVHQSILERPGRIWGQDSSPEHAGVARGGAFTGTGTGTVQRQPLQTQMDVKRRPGRHRWIWEQSLTGATPSGSCKQNNSTPFKDKWEPGYSAHNLGDFWNLKSSIIKCLKPSVTAIKPCNIRCHVKKYLLYCNKHHQRPSV